MLAIIIPVVILLLGILLQVADSNRKRSVPALAAIGPTLIIVGAVLCILSLAGLFHYTESKSFVAEYKGAQVTIENQRGRIQTFHERIAMAGKIIDLNSRLAKDKYWNSVPILGWYLPDELDDLEPIQ